MSDILARFEAVLGPGAVLTGKAAAEKAVSRITRLGKPIAVLLPSTIDHVSAAMQVAYELGVAVSPWGGKTGLVDGAFADNAVALSLERMNRIEEIDTAAGVMVVEAGCILQTACEAAEAEGLFLPLDLGSRGSATIGGNISTNAGGNRVLRYGMMRDMVLGLEVVLADGTIVSSLNRLIKNNAGHDLKQLFIGTEGTLGVVTRAVLRLRRAPVTQNAAVVGLAGFAEVCELLRRLEAGLGGCLSAFEVMWPEFYDVVTTPPAMGRPVLVGRHAYYVLIESLGGDDEGDANRFERVLGEALEAGIVEDATIAKSQAERDRMWALRDDAGQTVRELPIAAFDVSLGLSDMEAFVAAARRDLAVRWPDIHLTVFGHVADGNLHLIVALRDRQRRHDVEDLIYGLVRDRGGSVSAEHGIGLQKRAYLSWTRNDNEIALMRTLKRALDPSGILNPGKIFDQGQPG